MRIFLEAMAELVPEDERVLVSTVPGDPEQSAGEMWNVRPWRFGDRAPPENQNNYVCVSSFRRGAAGWRRTADLFGRALAFMVDDVGTKVPRSAVEALEPTARILTSPGNEQWWYLFREPVADYELFSRLISAFVQQRLAGLDPGMGGANRIGRLADGINGKAKYRAPNGEPFRCASITFDKTRRFTLQELVDAFALQLATPRRRNVSATPIEAQRRAELLLEFEELKGDCDRLRLLIKRHANHAGRIPIICPWYQRHTNASKTGTYLVEPNERNNWRGSFVCFHSSTHADDNHLKDIKRWTHEIITLQDSRLLAAANRAAPSRLADCASADSNPGLKVTA